MCVLLRQGLHGLMYPPPPLISEPPSVAGQQYQDPCSLGAAKGYTAGAIGVRGFGLEATNSNDILHRFFTCGKYDKSAPQCTGGPSGAQEPNLIA